MPQIFIQKKVYLPVANFQHFVKSFFLLISKLIKLHIKQTLCKHLDTYEDAARTFVEASNYNFLCLLITKSSGKTRVKHR